MESSNFITSLQIALGDTTPRLIGAVAILVIGWLGAVVIRAGMRKLLSTARLNKRIGGQADSEMNYESVIATGVFYVIMALVLVGFFGALNLEIVSAPLQSLVDKFFDFIPQLVAGGVLIIIAWIIAKLVRILVSRALAATSIDNKVTMAAGMKPMSENLGNVVYGLIFLVFLPAILDAFQLDGLLAPVQAMINKILSMLPNVLAAVIIGFVGWFVAKILRDLVSDLLTAIGTDSFGEKIGIKGAMSLSKMVGLIVFIFVFVPTLIAALNALQIEVISQPATAMLGTLMAAIPNIFAAAVILAAAYFISRFIAGVISNLLSGLGFNELPSKLGLDKALDKELGLSALAGNIIVFFIMLFATVEAANLLGFGKMSEIVSLFIRFGSHVLLGTVILAVGFWLSNLSYTAIIKVSGKSASAVANVARYAILGLVAAMGLRAMGIADDIVNIAFGLTLGAIAVAVALSFGLGGREAAGKQMEFWLAKLRK
ncbi:mechanosensitive ion channel [Pseudomonadota bacterium]